MGRGAAVYVWSRLLWGLLVARVRVRCVAVLRALVMFDCARGGRGTVYSGTFSSNIARSSESFSLGFPGEHGADSEADDHTPRGPYQ